MAAALMVALLLADASDQKFLNGRLDELATRYEELAARQTAGAIRGRSAIVRELAHLPFDGEARTRAGKFLGRVVSEDRSFRVRAESARAIGRVGTSAGLRAMYHALFGPDGRDRQYALLYTVLPEALSRLRQADDMEWISYRILQPAATGRDIPLFRIAGPLRHQLVALTLEGVGRARARALGLETVALARSKDPEVRVAALRALAALEVGDTAVRDALHDPDPRVRAAAAAYPRLPAAAARAALFDEEPLVRRAAIRGVAARKGKSAVDLLLVSVAAEEDRAARLDLLEALNELTGKDFGFDDELWSQWWAAQRDTFSGPEERDESGRVYFFEVGLRTERITFVIDVSASMSREDERRVSRLEHAARELGRTVRRLKPTVRFSLYTFSSSVRRHPSEPGSSQMAADAAWATQTLRKIRPSGATNTYGALLRALRDPFRPDTIVLLSDGNPYRCAFEGKTYSEHEQILAEVRRVNAEWEVRIHTVALLSGVDVAGDKEDAASAAEFLRRLAAGNRGEYREVR